MLQNFRDNLKGTVAAILVALISIPFIFFGVDSLFSGSSNAGKAAEVNDEVVTEAQLRRAISQRRDQLSQRFGDQVPADFLSDERLREPVLQGLIQRQLRVQAARDGRMTVGNAELDKLIVSVPQFQVDGKFDPQRFSYLVQSMGYTASGYRELIRQEIIASQLLGAVAMTSFVTEQQLQQHVQLAEQARDFYYVTLPLAPVLAATQVSAEDIQAYYEENRSQFLTPEQVVVDALELNVADLAARIDISDEQVAAQYQENMKSFAAAPVRHAAHILLEGEDAQAKLAQVQAALTEGRDFAALAAEFSDDLGTREQGGDLGFTSGDTFPEAFEQALAALAVGEVSAPVATDAGWHLIKLLELQQAELPSLEQEAPTIRMALQDAAAQQQFIELLERLKEDAYNSDDLQAVAEGLSLSVQTLPAFGRNGGVGLAADPRVAAAAFSDEVLHDGRISPVLELSETSVAVVKLREHMPEAVQALAEVRALVETQLRDAKAKAQLTEAGDQLLAQLRTGADVETTAQQAGAEWQVSYAVKRNDSRYDRALLRKVFDLVLAAEQPAYDSVQGQNGDLLLVKLTKVVAGDLSALDAAARQALAQRLADEMSNAETIALDAGLLADADVSVF